MRLPSSRSPLPVTAGQSRGTDQRSTISCEPSAQTAVRMEPLVVRVPEACRLSGLSRSELYRRMAAGQIHACKAGARTLVIVASLKAHLEGLPPATFGASEQGRPGPLGRARKARHADR